jgi:hypothetical protein
MDLSGMDQAHVETTEISFSDRPNPEKQREEDEAWLVKRPDMPTPEELLKSG